MKVLYEKLEKLTHSNAQVSLNQHASQSLLHEIMAQATKVDVSQK